MKRDRWESSSEDEAEAKTTTTTTIAVKKKQEPPSNKFPLHNPLLQGCRSVYDSYERLDRISEGTYGVVWKARDLATNEVVALKQIKFDADMTKEGFPISALREISVLLSLSHECVVTVREMVVGAALDKVFMVMELMTMDLKEAIEKNTQPFSQSELKFLIHSTLSGIQHCHNKWLLHRDLKTSNILVHSSGRIALADFGLARKYQHPLKALTQMVVTLWYRPPELLFGENVYGPAVDMWSIGCILGELIGNKDAILQGQGELDQIDKIFTLVGAPTETNWPDFGKLPSAGLLRWKTLDDASELRARFPVNSPSAGGQTFLDGNGFDLLSRLLTLDPKRRITADEALDHKYFKEGVAKAVPRFLF